MGKWFMVGQWENGSWVAGGPPVVGNGGNNGEHWASGNNGE